jgi:LemA protein
MKGGGNLNKTITAAVVIVIIFLIIAGIFIGEYNALASSNNTINQSWSEVQNQYERQYQLIPNIVQSANKYMEFEAGVFENVTLARTAWLNSQSQSIQKQVDAGAQLNVATGQFLATMENYPQLKSITVIQSLIDELAGTQNRITVARGRFIANIGDFNNMIVTFPGNVFAGMFGFHTRNYFVAQDQAQNVVNVTDYFK